MVAFNLYCRIPFGKIHKANHEIVKVAKLFGRTPSALAMKMLNFASFDPFHRSRNVSGLKNASSLDKAIWDEFHEDWEGLAAESQNLLSQMPSGVVGDLQGEFETTIDPASPTEVIRPTRVRLVQTFFRDAVMASYDRRCAICDVSLPELLNASHIIPWSKDVARRADPTNGLALCVFHDRSFDRGLVSFDDSYRMLLSKKAGVETDSALQREGLLNLVGKALRLPSRFRPDPAALRFHRESVFDA